MMRRLGHGVIARKLGSFLEEGRTEGRYEERKEGKKEEVSSDDGLVHQQRRCFVPSS
jgi:hypothetical protein